MIYEVEENRDEGYVMVVESEPPRCVAARSKSVNMAGRIAEALNIMPTAEALFGAAVRAVRAWGGGTTHDSRAEEREAVSALLRLVRTFAARRGLGDPLPEWPEDEP